MPLAISSYLAADSLADSKDELNLSWTSDERGCLGIDLPALVGAELDAEIRGGLEYVHSYLVTDPYAEQALGPAVASYFSLTSAPRVTCGAGVGSLLHGLARLAAGQRVGILGHVYPDFPFWVARSGGQCRSWHPDHDSDAPGIIFMERPQLVGGQSKLPALRHLGQEAMTRGALVLVDESNANYWPPSFSAVNLLAELPNLVVVRGLSKAYGLGGLRLSYCATSGGQATELVRSAVPPLLASSLSLRIGRRVLLAGDITAALRARIATAKDQTLALFRRAGLRHPRVGRVPSVHLLRRDGRSRCGAGPRPAGGGRDPGQRSPVLERGRRGRRGPPVPAERAVGPRTDGGPGRPPGPRASARRHGPLR